MYVSFRAYHSTITSYQFLDQLWCSALTITRYKSFPYKGKSSGIFKQKHKYLEVSSITWSFTKTVVVFFPSGPMQPQELSQCPTPGTVPILWIRSQVPSEISYYPHNSYATITPERPSVPLGHYYRVHDWARVLMTFSSAASKTASSIMKAVWPERIFSFISTLISWSFMIKYKVFNKRDLSSSSGSRISS